MPLRGASHYRVRSTAVAVVIVSHVAVLALLAIRTDREGAPPVDERMTLVFFDPFDESRASLHDQSRRRASRAAREIAAPPAEAMAPAADVSAAIPPGIDWYAHGADAAQRATAEPATRSFDFPRREPARRERKEFGWDKTHTERVHALEGGGIGIHLSDNCELVIAPFPMAGCALGRRKARGDLFDEMKAPVEPGDWKDR